MNFEDWWTKEYSHLSLGFHAKSCVKAGWDGAKEAALIEKDNIGALQTINQQGKGEICSRDICEYCENGPSVICHERCGQLYRLFEGRKLSPVA